MHLLRSLRLVGLLAAVVLLPARGAQAQSGTEILRGLVTTEDQKPVAGAEITILGVSTQTVQRASSNAKGSWTALFQNPEGDYVVTVRKIGYTPVRIAVRRTGISAILIADVVLKTSPFELDTMRVTANRPLSMGDRPSIGGFEQDILSNQLFALDPSDLLSLILQVPGILGVGDSAFSALGAATDQNNTTLDGASFRGGNLPRDAMSSSRVVMSSADPARGTFAGAQTTTSLRGGNDIFAANLRGNFTGRDLAWVDPLWTSPISQRASFSGSAGGPIKKQKLYYQFSFDGGDDRNEVFSLLSPRQSILSQYGMLPDTVAALAGALQQLGVPRTTSAIPDQRIGQRLGTSLVLDFRPTSTTTLRLTHSGNWNTSDGGGISPMAFPTNASKNSGAFHFVSAKFSGYFKGMLNELTTSLNYNHNEGDMYLAVPSASVRVGTVFDGGRTGLGTLRFGGGGGRNESSGYYGEVVNELSWLTKDSKHRFKVGGSLNFERNTNFSTSGSPYGSYTFQTLTDLLANRPATYTRTLSTFERTSTGNIASAWVGDEFRVSPALQLQYGLRVDRTHPGTTPQYNPVVDSLFGLRTNQVPRDVGVVPRLGFSWVSKARRTGTGGGGSSGGGPQIQLPPGVSLANLPPEMLQMFMGGSRTSGLPGITISGSIGGYKGTTSSGRIAGLVDQTGLPMTRRILTCTGDAAPTPVWTEGAAPPEECLDGTAPGVFSGNQPTVSVFDPGFRAPTSWRANLGIDGLRLFKWNLGVNSNFSYGVNGESGLDMNLQRTAKFTIDGEGGRPVYADPTAIVPGTGAIAPGASRIHPAYSRVTNTISDLENYTANLSLNLAPPRPLLNGKLNVSFGYTLTHQRAEQRGFGAGGGGGNFEIRVVEGGFGSFSSGGFGGGNTAGDPFQKEWVSGASPTHTFTMNLNTRLWWFNLNMRTNFFSGRPYTPTVVGDVNGDGSSNDRAFIFDPAVAADAGLAAELSELLSHAPGGAAACLRKQMGRVAGANSCRTDWQARLDLNMNFNPPQSFGWGDRLRITTNMVNASGALVRLFGLEDTPLGRSAASTSVDSRLLYVTGFDPATKRYTYRVNQLFGEPQDFGTARRRSPPFQVQLGVEYKFGGPPTQPMSRSLGLLTPKGEPVLTEAQIKDKLARSRRDPIAPILARKDSLALAPEQLAGLQAINAEFTAKTDTLLAPVIEYVLKKGKRVTDQDLSPKMSKATTGISRATAEALTKAMALLTPAQRAKIAPAPGARPGMMAAPQGTGEGPRPGGAPVKIGGGSGVEIIKN